MVNELALLELFDYDNGMARPLKDPRLRMDTDIRIPVTQEQKQLILEAASVEPAGLAQWARSVLIEAAHRRKAMPGKIKRVSTRHKAGPST